VKNRKNIYVILTVFFAVLFFVWDNYSVEEIIPTTDKTEFDKKSKSSFFPTSTTGQIIHHNYYSLSYHENFEQAEWVAYELNENHLANTNFKRPYFEKDSKVRTKSAHYRNYKDSGYNKGHLCPAGDRKFSKEAFDETFLMSNVSPQIYEFNSGIWNRLEQKTRFWASKYDKLFIVTGGILEPNLKTIGSEKVAVPNYFYKIILDFQEPEIKAIAFLMPHNESEKALYKFVTSIDEIEKLTGIDFFPELEDSIENKLEESTSYSNWSFR